MIERAAAGASVELKGASAHASLCLRLCARHQRSRYPSDLRVTRAARSMRALGDVSNAEGPFINESVNWSSDDDSPRRRPLTGDSLRLIDEQDWRALVAGYLRYTGRCADASERPGPTPLPTNGQLRTRWSSVADQTWPRGRPKSGHRTKRELFRARPLGDFLYQLTVFINPTDCRTRSTPCKSFLIQT
jgi:hypothetical protein